MHKKRLIWAGLAAGLLGHILQGSLAYLFFDRFYLENPELLRDSNMLVGLYYMILNLIVGLAIAWLAHIFKGIWRGRAWLAGVKAGFVVWVVSSPIFIIKRQIILNLPNWLLLEIPADLAIYILIGAVAGFLCGPGITGSGKDKI